MSAYLIAAMAIMAAIITGLWWRMDSLAKERDALQSQVDAARRSDVILTKYVDRIVEVEKRVPVVRNHLVELCNGAAMPSGARAAGPAGAADTHDGQIAGLAADIGSCKANAEQLDALTSWVHANGG